MVQQKPKETEDELPKVLTTAQLPDEFTKETAFFPQLRFILLELNVDWARKLINWDKYLLLGRYDGETDEEFDDLYINVSKAEYGDIVGAISKRHILIYPRSKGFRVHTEAKTTTEYEDINHYFIPERGLEYDFYDSGKFVIGNVRIIVKLVGSNELGEKPYRLTPYELPDKHIGEMPGKERSEPTKEDIQKLEKLRQFEQTIFDAVRPLLQNHSPEDIKTAVSGASNKLLAEYARDEHLNRVCDEVIEEIRDNARTANHPTKLEQVLEIFRDANGERVSIDDLTHLYKGIYSERQAASNAIVKLNEKLAKHDLQIVPFHHYHIISTKAKS